MKSKNHVPGTFSGLFGVVPGTLLDWSLDEDRTVLIFTLYRSHLALLEERKGRLLFKTAKGEVLVLDRYLPPLPETDPLLRLRGRAFGNRLLLPLLRGPESFHLYIAPQGPEGRELVLDYASRLLRRPVFSAMWGGLVKASFPMASGHEAYLIRV